MNILSLLKSKGPATVPALRDKLAKLEAVNPFARKPELETARHGALMAGDDEQVATFDAEIVALARDSERKAIALENLRREIGEAEQREHAAEVDRLVAEARAVSKDAIAALKSYPEAAQKIVGILETAARAEAAIAAANGALPAGSTPLPSVEQSVRGLPGLPRKDVRVTETDTWCFARGTGKSEVEPRDIGNIESADGVTGILARRTHTGATWDHPVPVHKRVRRRVDYMESWSAYRPEPLAATITLPGLLPGQCAVWAPCGPDQVLDKVADLKAEGRKPPSDPRGEPDKRPCYWTISIVDEQPKLEPATEAA
jgi:hypothetical protein